MGRRDLSDMYAQGLTAPKGKWRHIWLILTAHTTCNIKGQFLDLFYLLFTLMICLIVSDIKLYADIYVLE